MSITIEGSTLTSTLTLSALLDHVVMDRDGRLFVPMVDVLALMRLDVDAEILLVTHHDGSSTALRIAALVSGADDTSLYLQVRRTLADVSSTVVPRLWRADTAPSAPVRSLRGLTFAAFAGAW
jgi:hypothetical protein